MEAFVCRHDGVLSLNRQGKVETVVNWMTEIGAQPRRCRGEFEHRSGKRDRCRTQRVHGFGHIVRRQFATLVHGPERIGDLREEKRWCDEPRSAANETDRLFGMVFLNQPLNSDAGIHHIPSHVALSRSRSARITMLLSTEERSRRRNAAARATKSSFVPSSVARRISRCSASADRPLAAARRLSAPTTSASNFLTVSCATNYAFNAVSSLPSIIVAHCACRTRPDRHGVVIAVAFPGGNCLGALDQRLRSTYAAVSGSSGWVMRSLHRACGLCAHLHGSRAAGRLTDALTALDPGAGGGRRLAIIHSNQWPMENVLVIP